MKMLLKKLLKHSKIMFLVLSITSIGVVVISMISKYKISSVFTYAAAGYFVIGGLSTLGSLGGQIMTTDIKYLQARSVSSRSISQSSVSDHNSRGRGTGFKFLMRMAILAAVLFVIGRFLTIFNI